MSNIAKHLSPAKHRLFHGYWILVVAFLYLFAFSGCGVGVFSLFVTPLQSDFGWGRGEIMVAFTLFFLLTGVAAPFIGGLVDRYGVRGVISTGAGVIGLGFVSLTRLESLWHLYLAYTFIGAGMAAIGQVPSSALVANWFKKRRGTAIGVMSTGIGTGILVLAPVIGGYVIPNLGWRVAYLALAVLAWALIPLTLFIVKTKPEEMGLHPDGNETSASIGAPEATLSDFKGLSLKMVLGTTAFWLMAVSFFINGIGSMGVIQNQVPHLQDIGFPLSQAASALTGLGIGSAVGKFFFGWLCDRIPAKHAFAISIFLLIIGTAILMNLKAASPMAIIWLYAVVNGLGNGGWLPTMSMLVNVNFGLSSYGVIMGMISLAQAIGAAAGPLVAGYMYDTMDTYTLAFTIFLVSFFIAIAAILAVRRPRK